MTSISNVSGSGSATPETAFDLKQVLRGLLINTVGVAFAIGLLSLFMSHVLHPLVDSLDVDEEFTQVLADLLLTLLPFAIYLTVGISTRKLRSQRPWFAAGLTLAGVTLVFFLITTTESLGDSDTDDGLQPSLQFTAVQTAEGILVEALEANGAAEVGGLQVGDIITAIRRDEVSLDELNQRVLEAEDDAPFRLRLLRDGEEIQLTVRTVLVESAAAGFDFEGYALSWAVTVIVGLLGLFGPAGWTPYILLAFSLSPLLLGYAWLVIATFSYRTHGLTPVDANDQLGGLTLSNWDFLKGGGLVGQTTSIWNYTANSLIIAITMTTVSLLLCSMAGYALSRMEFSGRRFFLSLTLILHSFPTITLLIPVYLVLLNLGDIPFIGPYIGFNSLGGIALVMVSFGMPFGVWLMKGFFDNISWDMERSALIDGATRWRTFWEIILPQIRPGLLALGVFSFMGGWNAYLIPAIFSVGTKAQNLPVYIRQLTGEVNPVNWNQVAAVGLFQMVPILLLFIFAQEYLLNIYSGGSKGSS